MLIWDVLNVSMLPRKFTHTRVLMSVMWVADHRCCATLSYERRSCWSAHAQWSHSVGDDLSEPSRFPSHDVADLLVLLICLTSLSVAVMLADRANAELLQFLNIILYHIHSSDPVIDLNCQCNCNLYPVSTKNQWNPTRQRSLGASSASLSSGHLFPGSVSFCQVSRDASNQRHYWINSLLHKVSPRHSRVWTWCQKGSWGKNQHTLMTVLWPSAKHVKSVNATEHSHPTQFLIKSI